MEQDQLNVTNELRLRGKFCDVVIVANGGVKFVAHKIVLCKRSIFFRDLFITNSTEQKTYDFPQIEPEIMELILKHLYDCFVNITQHNVEGLLSGSNILNVVCLKRLCSDFLMDKLDIGNCISTLCMAELHFCPDLQTKAKNFLLYHFQDVALESEEFLTLPVDKLCSLIKRDELNITNESVVFHAILRWIAHDVENRKSEIIVLLQQVRMGLIEDDNCIERVMDNEMLQTNEECRLFLSEAAQAINARRTGNIALPMARPRLPWQMLIAVDYCDNDDVNNFIEAYNIRADFWEITTLETISRAQYGIAYLNGFVYYLGGYENDQYLNSVWKLNLTQITWQEVAPMHKHRTCASVVALDGYIYAIGGCDAYEYHRTAERYDPTTNQWSLIAPMRNIRNEASATILDGKVYICGGHDDIEISHTAECYDPSTDQWTAITSMENARTALGVIAYKQCIFAVGGFNGTETLSSIEAYNPTTNTWKQMPPMSTPRSNFGIAVLEDLLVVVGGVHDSNNLCSIEIYNGETEQWQNGTDMHHNHGTLACCVVPQNFLSHSF